MASAVATHWNGLGDLSYSARYSKTRKIMDPKGVYSTDIKVPGNSGCIVEVILIGQQLAVRKTASSAEYALRLRNQRVKQESFNLAVKGIRVPKVITYDEMSFTMEHLQMLDCIEFFERATPKILSSRMEILLELIGRELETSTPTEVDSEVFKNKLANIQESVLPGVWQRFYSNHACEIERALAQRVVVPVGTCHGDLTLSNVMLSLEDNCVGIIDFLDSYIDSPIVDLVKLRQDTRFHWTSYRYPSQHDRGKIHIVNRWVNEVVTQVFHDLVVTRAFWVIEMMNYLRIAPYVHTESEHHFLSQVLSRIQSMQEDRSCD